jgi:hypothetical protein
MAATYKVLILGASYGSLLGAKLLLAGHDVTLICRAVSAEAINRSGVRVRLPVSWKTEHLEIDSRDLRGHLSAATPDAVDPRRFDLVALAMGEPQYSQAGVRELLDAVALARVPCLSIMNMPPPPYLKRIPNLDTEALAACYTDVGVWQNFDPAVMTLCSPDPQAFRPSAQAPNVLQVTLPTNFKAARFASSEHTEILRRIETQIAESLYQDSELPVKLKVSESIFVPLAKWPMLLTGNYRCLQATGARAIRDAVHSDPEASQSIYQWVSHLCIALGASSADLVPFKKYAAAANDLVNPSSVARALVNGATNVERVDRLIQAIAVQKGMHSPAVDEIVSLTDAQLKVNRERDTGRPLISA